jgi:thiamine biosynthesis lipoprotein
MGNQRYRTVLYLFALIVMTVALFTTYTYLPAGNDNERGNDLIAESNVSSNIIITESQHMMGTIVTIEIFGKKTNSETTISSAFREIDRIEKLMTTFDSNSEIGILNAEGQVDNVSDDLIYVIEQSIYYGNISDGAFDVTIKPILDLWKTKIIAGEYPSGQEINETLTLVNYNNITVENKTIYFNTEGMSITVDGIAKGYAVDRAVDVLKNNGYTSGFVNAGGDGMYFGTRPDGSYWKVGLRNPENKSQSIVVMEISDMAVATSGNYERYFNESALLSHISDPRTGYSSQSLLSATIIAGSAMEADTLATAVFVLGPDKGLKLIENIQYTECLLITPENEIITSSGFDTYLLNS